MKYNSKILDKFNDTDRLILTKTAERMDWNVEDLIVYLTTKSIQAINEIRRFKKRGH